MILITAGIVKFFFVLVLCAWPATAQKKHGVEVKTRGFNISSLDAAPNDIIAFIWPSALALQAIHDDYDYKVKWASNEKSAKEMCSKEISNEHLIGINCSISNSFTCNPTEFRLEERDATSYWFFVIQQDSCTLPPLIVHITSGASTSKSHKGVLIAGIVLIILAVGGSALAFWYSTRKLRAAKGGSSYSSQSAVLTSPGNTGVAHAPPTSGLSPPVVLLGRTLPEIPSSNQHLAVSQKADQDSDSDSLQADDPFGSNQFSSIEYRPGESGRTTGRY